MKNFPTPALPQKPLPLTVDHGALSWLNRARQRVQPWLAALTVIGTAAGCEDPLALDDAIEDGDMICAEASDQAGTEFPKNLSLLNRGDVSTMFIIVDVEGGQVQIGADQNWRITVAGKTVNSQGLSFLADINNSTGTLDDMTINGSTDYEFDGHTHNIDMTFEIEGTGGETVQLTVSSPILNGDLVTDGLLVYTDDFEAAEATHSWEVSPEDVERAPFLHSDDDEEDDEEDENPFNEFTFCRDELDLAA